MMTFRGFAGTVILPWVARYRRVSGSFGGGARFGGRRCGKAWRARSCHFLEGRLIRFGYRDAGGGAFGLQLVQFG